MRCDSKQGFYRNFLFSPFFFFPNICNILHFWLSAPKIPTFPKAPLGYTTSSVLGKENNIETDKGRLLQIYKYFNKFFNVDKVYEHI